MKKSKSSSSIKGDGKQAALPVIDKRRRISVADLMIKTMRCGSRGGSRADSLLVKGEGKPSLSTALF